MKQTVTAGRVFIFIFLGQQQRFLLFIHEVDDHPRVRYPQSRSGLKEFRLKCQGFHEHTILWSYFCIHGGRCWGDSVICHSNEASRPLQKMTTAHSFLVGWGLVLSGVLISPPCRSAQAGGNDGALR